VKRVYSRTLFLYFSRRYGDAISAKEGKNVSVGKVFPFLGPKHRLLAGRGACRELLFYAYRSIFLLMNKLRTAKSTS
jgi:hypothetical protein